MAQDNADILARIRERKQMGEDNIQSEKDAIEADIALIRGRKKKGKENLIWDFTLDVAANLSHNGDGWDSFEVNISTWSPLFNNDFRGWRLPFIFAATHLSPISECIE